MTKTKRNAAVALGLIIAGGAMLVSTTAMARGPMADVEFSTLDTDGDGEITTEEFAAFRLARIMAIDTNGDGIVSLEEIEAARETQASRSAEKRHERMLEKLDANEDGQLSVEELAAGAGRRGNGDGFPSRIDTDGSGGISAEEFAEMKEKAGKRRGKGKHGKGHGDGQDGESSQ